MTIIGDFDSQLSRQYKYRQIKKENNEITMIYGQFYIVYDPRFARW